MNSAEIWRCWWRVRAERRRWTRLIVPCSSIQARLPIVSQHSCHSRNKRKDLEVQEGGEGGGSAHPGRTRQTYSTVSELHVTVGLFGKRQIAAAFVVFVSVSKCTQKAERGWPGQGGAAAWLAHSSPLRPTRHNGTDAVTRRVLGNNIISLLHSPLAVSKGLIQCIAALPYLHTNKGEDVDSYRCASSFPHPTCLGLHASFSSFSQKPAWMSD